jgi:glycine/D-amino acid oxidase-like deaminating enzyme
MDDAGHVLIVGGGVIGLTTAATLLACAPHLSVTVLERATAGAGTSAHAGALDIPYYRTAFQRELVEASWAWHEARAAEASAYRRAVAMIWHREPTIDLGAHLVPLVARDTCFVIDPGAWCRALAREIVRSGRGIVVERTEVIALEPGQHGPLRATCSDGRSYTADHAVLALGPWLARWSATRRWAASSGLRTKRVYGLNLAIDASADPRGAAGWPGQDIYLHPAPAGDEYRLSLRHDEWDVDPDGDHRMAGEVLTRAHAFLDDVLGPGRWRITGHRVFADSYTPGFEAVVAPCSPLGDAVTVATGTHGSGIRMAPGIAERVARAVLDRMTRSAGAA